MTIIVKPAQIENSTFVDEVLSEFDGSYLVDSEGGAAALDLYNGHIKESVIDEEAGYSYRLTIKDYGEGDISGTITKVDTPFLRSKNDTERVSRTRSEMTPENAQKSLIRAKTQLRDKIMMMKASSMLTLTFRENVTDLKQAYKCLDKFSRAMAKQYGHFDYVSVPEYQKRGAIHFHIAINARYNYNVVRFLWRKAICGNGKETVGNIDITKRRKANGWTRALIANYLSKYMNKNIDSQEINKKRYSSSRGIPLPRKETKYILFGGDTFGIVKEYIFNKYGKNIGDIVQIENAERLLYWFSTFSPPKRKK